ncbi:MAG: aspartate ammonia-lyase [Syntrophorhabdaceae bacterium]|nr:aspartate ammonia-lyase [Syntrophorhabdaceae bacterium]
MGKKDSIYRVERDLLGSLEIPADKYYGIHTQRAIENFSVSGMKVHPELITAFAIVKKAAALANKEIGLLEKKIAEAIILASEDIIGGHLHEDIVVDAFQGGAGTSLNMNINEVIANRAIELMGGQKGDYSLVDPIDHVNLGQSTNDTYPTALRIAAIKLIREAASSMAHLQGELQVKEKAYASILKVGRTEMQDAVPVTVGQEFGAWAEGVARDWWRLYKAEERLRQVNIGGTAVGTGLNAGKTYIYRVIEILRDLTGFGLARAENPFEATQNADIYGEVSGFLKAAAINLAKIASDIRLLSSGPKAGIGELKLPEVQAGSSIMPGKVNPVITEMVTELSYQIIANDVAISIASASGQLELNPFMPLIAHCLLGSLTLLKNGARLFADRCIKGIVVDEEKCSSHFKASQGIVTAFAPYIGYKKATDIALKSYERNIPVTEILIEEGLFTEDEIEAILKPEELTTPGIAGAKYLREKRKKHES